MFGTSFTSAAAHHIETARRQANSQAALSSRLDDFERALANPDANERLQFARRLLPDGAPVRPRLLSMIDRVDEGRARLMRG